MRSRTRADQEGFTLIELIIAVAIMTIVVGALAGAMIGWFKGSQDVVDALSESTDTIFLTAHFGPDVQAATTLSVVATADPAYPNCPTTGDFLELTNATQRVTYSMTADASIVRRLCTPGATGTAVDNPLTHSTVSTAPTGNGSPHSEISVECACNLSGPASAAAITKVSVKVVELPLRGAAVDDSYSFVLSATPRISVAATPPSPNVIPLYIVGVGGNLNMAGNPTLTIKGDGQINSTSINTIAGSVNFGAPGEVIYMGGSCNPNGQNSLCNPFKNPRKYPNADPFAGLVVPPLGATHPGPGYAGPGTYTGTANFASAPGQTSLALAPGVYVFNAGLTVTTNLTGAGVLLYFPTLTANLTFNGGSITGISPATTGAYAGLDLWIDASNTNTIDENSLTPNGVVYAPAATLNMKGTGNAPAFLVKGLIVGFITLGGNAKITIG